MSDTLSTLAQKLRPYWLKDLSPGTYALISGGGGSMVAHALNGPYHAGTLDQSQAPWAALAARVISAGAGLTGGGDLAADRALNVGAGTLITVGADDVGITPGAAYQFVGTGSGTAAAWQNIAGLAGAGLGYAAGVLSVGVANTGAVGLSVEADVVRLTSSSNPGAAAAVLASDASGMLELVKLRTGLIDTGSGNTTLRPAGDLVLDPVGNDVLPETNYDINLGLINKKWLTLHAAELWVETLVAQNTIATIGGRILVGPTTTLTRDLAAAATTIYVKHNQMVSGDRTYMEANGFVEFFAITSGPTLQGAGDYAYTVTRNLDGTGANDWYAGDAMFNTGQTGSGFIDLYSVRGVKTASQAGPTIVGSVRTGTAYNAWAERWAAGNLNGLYGYGVDTYGFAAGAPGATWIAVDATNGVMMMRGSVARLQIDTAGNLQIRDSGGNNVIALDNTGSSYFAGVMTIGTAGEIRQGTGTLGSNYTGLRIWRDGNIGRIGGYNADVLQWYANTDGRLYAGAGSTIIDGAGLTLKLDTDVFAVSSVKWAPSTGAAAQAHLTAYRSPSAGNVHVYLSAYPSTAGANAHIHFSAIKQDATPGSIDFLGFATFQQPVEIQGGNGSLLNLLGYGTGQTLITYNPRNTGRKAYVGFNTAASGDFSVMQEETSVGNLYLGTNSNIRVAVHYDGRVATGSNAWVSNEAVTVNGIAGVAALLGIHSGNGYVQIGPNNTSYCHFVTDRPAYYFDHPLVITNTLSSYSADLDLMRGGVSRLALTTNGGTLTGALTLGTVYNSGTGEPAAPSTGAVLYIWDTGSAKEFRIRFAGGSGIKIVGT